MILDTLIQLLAQHWAAVILAVVSAWLVRNRYHNGLNKYPGPFLASLTDWWRFYDVYKQRPERTHIALHKKHGKIVRLGPNVLSFSDPEAAKTIYGLNKGFVKVFPPSLSPISYHHPLTHSLNPPPNSPTST